MGLKQTFVRNLKQFRKIEHISQMKLAEKCESDVNYIGQIEMGMRFPSIRLIEKIAAALQLEPYRLFMEEPAAAFGEMDPAVDLLTKLPASARQALVVYLNAALGECVKDALTP